jgi:hypothetical protein
MLSWDESEGNLSTALAVPGMKMARAWLGLCNGTGELLSATRVPEDWNRNSPEDRQAANPRVAEYRKRARRAERPVMCAGRRRELTGESPVGPAPSGVRSRRRG